MAITFMQLLLMIILIWICVYTILNRICKCFEHCMTTRSFNKYCDTTKKETEKEGKKDDKTGSSTEEM
jgi:hypothetical protein